MSQDSSSSSSSSSSNSDAADNPPSSSSSSSSSLPDSLPKIKTAIDSLSSFVPKLPPALVNSKDPAFTLLHDTAISSRVCSLLRLPDSGSGDNNLCRWLYDTFQSSVPQLQLVVLRFLPIIAGVYISRVHLKKPLAGFEAVLLALYAHETSMRDGQAITINIPDLSVRSIYHEAKEHTKSNSTDLSLAVISPSLDPYGTVRSTRRARIIGVALELYFSKISFMPTRSKIDFCEFCEVWAGQDGEMYNEEGSSSHGKKAANDEKKKEGRIPLPWEILQPSLRILGHCLMGQKKEKELFEAASCACRSLYARSLHDINPKAILATGSLLRLSKLAMDPKYNIDHTEIEFSDVINL